MSSRANQDVTVQLSRAGIIFQLALQESEKITSCRKFTALPCDTHFIVYIELGPTHWARSATGSTNFTDGLIINVTILYNS